MQKKANISTETIIYAVIALTVLILLLIIFRTQIGKSAGGIGSVSDEANKGLKGENCKTLFGDRICGLNEPNGYTCNIVPNKPSGGWKDCPGAECCELVKTT